MTRMMECKRKIVMMKKKRRTQLHRRKKNHVCLVTCLVVRFVLLMEIINMITITLYALTVTILYYSLTIVIPPTLKSWVKLENTLTWVLLLLRTPIGFASIPGTTPYVSHL